MTTHFPFTDSYSTALLQEGMMGPNAMRIMEELTARLDIQPGMRVLDLGCGKGLSSILLAEKYAATVFAADLWISPTENAQRFAGLKLEKQKFPLLVDATQPLPFAEGYFDLIVSVDAYQYFGGNDVMLGKLLPYLKPGGQIAVAVPGFIGDYSPENLPDIVKPFWTPEWYFYSCAWWRALWLKESGLQHFSLREMDCCQQAWDEFMLCPMAQETMVPIMDAGAGRYFNVIALSGRRPQ